MEPLASEELYKAQYQVERKVGQGGFGKVYLVRRAGDQEAFAAKCVRARSRKDKERARGEVEMLQGLDNQFIMRLVGGFESAAEVILVTEFLAGGELFERVVDEEFALTEADCVLFLRQICQGLLYLHHRHIAHLDLKVDRHHYNFRSQRTLW